MKEWKPLVEWFGERYVSKNIRGVHIPQHFFGARKVFWALTVNHVGQPCFVIIFCEILKKLFTKSIAG